MLLRCIRRQSELMMLLCYIRLREGLTMSLCWRQLHQEFLVVQRRRAQPQKKRNKRALVHIKNFASERVEGMY